MKTLACVLLVAAAAFAVGAPAATKPPSFLGCYSFTGGQPKEPVRPASILVACGDGGFTLTNLRWSHWKSGSAVAKGIGSANDCTPNCAAGHFRSASVTVTLTSPVKCHGARVFTRIAWHFSKTKPPTKNGFVTFPCR